MRPEPVEWGPVEQHLAARSEEWLLDRSIALATPAGHGTLPEQRAAIAELDRLVTEVRRRGGVPLLTLVLGRAVGARVASAGAGHRADHLLTELLWHARRHGLWLTEAAALASAARQAVFAGRDDLAMEHVAAAQAILDAGGDRYRWLDLPIWRRMQCTVANDIALTLAQLGIFERAEAMLAHAQRIDQEAGPATGTAVLMLNRVRVTLGWGLRLERVGDAAGAAEKFATAAAVAHAVQRPWSRSVLPGHERPAVEVNPVLAAALAMADPHPGHLDRLRRMLAESVYARQIITVAIATSRCLERGGDPARGLRVLRQVRRRLTGDSSEPSLAVSLAYQTARLARSVDAGLAYADALEAELWELQQARVAALRTRVDYERLDRRYREIARQAGEDPLTGLVNRRALTGILDAVVADPGAAPLAVAMVDVDGFKAVNDGGSHADGDAVLRAVAETLRNSLGGDDVVARYGGDEFVVLLHRTTIMAARAALTRMSRAVAALPVEHGRGVTVSVGVAAVRPGESGADALGRADAAMYRAKRAGGNRIRSGGEAGAAVAERVSE